MKGITAVNETEEHSLHAAINFTSENPILLH